MKPITRLLIHLLACIVITACQALPDLTGGPPSHAVRPVSNPAFAMPSGPATSGTSNVALLPDGPEAFKARVGLARGARQSLDIQYYIWDGDECGSILLEELLAAADRGVRVRLLLDDFSSPGLIGSVVSELRDGMRAVIADLEDGVALITPDAIERTDRMRVMMNEIQTGGRALLTAALDTHPNVEVRLFNPFTHTGPGAILRYLELVRDFNRLNHRMHNKVFAADNQLVIVGGRNISNSYFNQSDAYNFRDLDLLVGGAAAREVSENFDLYWNSRWAMPVRAFAWEGVSRNRLADLRREIREFLLQGATHPFHSDPNRIAPESALANVIKRMHPARVSVLADTPDKLRGGETLVAVQLGSLAAESQSEILIENAYFVPSNRTFAKVEEQLAHGVSVRTLTNSLASNDMLPAHSGYARHRGNLLHSGVEVRELAVREAGAPPDTPDTRLHTKAMVFDREKVFIGTFNLDPRSAELNTEIGVLVECAALAEEVAAFIQNGMEPERSWRVSLCRNENSQARCRPGQLLWLGEFSDPPVIKSKDPQTRAWQRSATRLLQLLPIEPLL